MTPAELHALRHLSGFPESATALIRVVGLEAAAALITAWPGQKAPIPFPSSVQGRWYARLEEVVGGPAAMSICRYYGGGELYVPTLHRVRGAIERDAIRAEFDRRTAEGESYTDAVFALGLQFKRTSRDIERALGQPDTPPAPVPEQCVLF
jgi:hypothetical protein